MKKSIEERELEDKLVKEFDNFVLENNIEEHSQKYWELFEEMVDAPFEKIKNMRIEEWTNCDERKEFLENQEKTRLQMLLA